MELTYKPVKITKISVCASYIENGLQKILEKKLIGKTNRNKQKAQYIKASRIQLKYVL